MGHSRRFAVAAGAVGLVDPDTPRSSSSGDAVTPLALSKWSGTSSRSLQYFIVKVLEVSVGFWLLNTTTDYIACRFEHHTASCKTVSFLFVELAEYMFVAGLLFGLIEWMRRWRRSLASPD
jgi:hypothetical protein